MCAGAGVGLFDDGTPPPVRPLVGPRIGISKAVEVPWRFPCAARSKRVLSRIRNGHTGRMRRLMTATLAALVAFGASAYAATTTGTATVDERADRVAPVEQPVLLVSDSAWLGIKTYGAKDALRGVDHVMDLASCRRRVTGSCRNYDGHVPITLLDELGAHGTHFHTLVVATGYNDSDHNFRSDVDTIVRRAQSSATNGSCG
ncbi:MAG: hypothetical protein R2697_04420 [Ilumatobacteraceae bacterium]